MRDERRTPKLLKVVSNAFESLVVRQKTLQCHASGNSGWL